MTDIPEIRKSLEDRMLDDVANCIRTGEHVKIGNDKHGKGVAYCTYFFLEAGREPVDCAYRGNRVEVERHSAVGTVYMEYYRCNRWQRKK